MDKLYTYGQSIAHIDKALHTCKKPYTHEQAVHTWKSHTHTDKAVHT